MTYAVEAVASRVVRKVLTHILVKMLELDFLEWQYVDVSDY